MYNKDDIPEHREVTKWPNGVTGEQTPTGHSVRLRRTAFPVAVSVERLVLRVRILLPDRVIGTIMVVIDGEAEMADQEFLHSDSENQKHEIEKPKNDDRHGGAPDNHLPQVTITRNGKVTGRNENQQCHRQQDNAGDKSQESFMIVLDHRDVRFFKGVNSSEVNQ